MNPTDAHRTQEAAEQDAIAWLLRVDAPDATEADWLGLQAWLEAAAENRVAYDRVERLNAELQAAVPDLLTALDARPGVAQARRAQGSRRASRPMNRRMFAGLAAAAAAAAVVVFVSVRPAAPPPPTLYETAKGENRELVLADGSRVHLNSASRISVRFEKDRRRVELAEGEAAFDVTHDAERPFVIAAGERDIRVVGTEFDVLRHRGALRVTVRRGVVAVEPPARSNVSAAPVLLRAGDQLDHRAGTRLWTVSQVDPEAVFAWKRGELVYSDRPLADVVADLNRYVATPIEVAGPAASLRFSGVLRIDDEAAMVRRLEAFLPVEAARTDAGLVLSLRPGRG